ncbi:hypothetical protein [Spirosoma validum]|uniref:Uncharacterized protein n=1 Tax=Spirosoma validum TaxID=2771355 RepID=A0A927GFS6_9BACT|nr:hypothetical protein [Spirosoma validum]MBD2756129.1 hypothetical protein [Spirosoma validum]
MHPNLSHLYEETPVWLNASMVAITILTVGTLYVAIRRAAAISATRFLLVSISWMTVLGLLAYNHFFQQLNAVPPRFILVIGPPLLLIGSFFVTEKGRYWIRQLPLSVMTLLHTVRLPVELTLYGLYLHQQIPQLMTFDGRNLDILAGLTAPIVAYFAFCRRQLSARWLLLWNVLALGLVINIVVQAILSAPLPFQQMAFDQPNVAVLKAPYVWLPGVIVPIVLFSHAVAIHRLVKEFVSKQIPS